MYFKLYGTSFWMPFQQEYTTLLQSYFLIFGIISFFFIFFVIEYLKRYLITWLKLLFTKFTVIDGDYLYELFKWLQKIQQLFLLWSLKKNVNTVSVNPRKSIKKCPRIPFSNSYNSNILSHFSRPSDHLLMRFEYF